MKKATEKPPPLPPTHGGGLKAQPEVGDATEINHQTLFCISDTFSKVLLLAKIR